MNFSYTLEIFDKILASLSLPFVLRPFNALIEASKKKFRKNICIFFNQGSSM